MSPKNEGNGEQQPPQITGIAVSGFKSLATEQSIEVRPLILLAGANSSGKSSLMQAVLLLKQTLEAPYDPGPLLLNGPNVRFTSADQLLFHGAGTKCNEILIRVERGDHESFEVVFSHHPRRGMDVQHCRYRFSDHSDRTVSANMTVAEVQRLSALSQLQSLGYPAEIKWESKIIRERFFLRPYVTVQSPGRIAAPIFDHFWSKVAEYSRIIQDIIHLPGLRGNPERTYPLTATGPEFPGPFENYTASVVSHWSRHSRELLEQLGDDLNSLGLTWKVEAKAVDDTQVELRVGRLRKPQRGGSKDLVNIADVGFGVSQTLPVLVALLAARPGQLLYIEQPEIHLHPRAQVAMASLLAKAAKRGVRVVAETHSSLLLLGVQSQVADGKLSPDKVKLHWFSRSETNGATTVTSADLDEAGRFGDWPEDFDDATLRAQKDYLDSAQSRLFAG